MFFGVRDPFSYMRDQVESGLRKQKKDSVLNAVKGFDTPKFLTIGRGADKNKNLVVTHFGTCYRARLYVTHDQGAHSEIDATLTFLFGDVHLRGVEKNRNYIDLGTDAEKAFHEDEFRQRFLTFRAAECAPATPPKPRRKFW